MNETLPGNRRLVKTWLLLMALTVLSMWSAQLNSHSGWLPLPIWGIALVLISAGFKVQQILMVYLNLRVSSAGWKSGFICLLVATVLLVFLAYLSADLK
tara:strand:- start:5439 stop:5735 length:297 start_codon:yes stop_codon:yes gene_type:complete